jgi:hypothetical protein
MGQTLTDVASGPNHTTPRNRRKKTIRNKWDGVNVCDMQAESLNSIIWKNIYCPSHQIVIQGKSHGFNGADLCVGHYLRFYGNV